MKQYAIGIDFGTLSARAVAVDIKTGKIISSAESVYAHGVITDKVPNGKKLPPDWAIQIPSDYTESLYNSVSTLMKDSGLSAEQIIGIGIDVTASTMVPVKADGTPLATMEEYRQDPNAYVKIWKHHGASAYAQRISDTAISENEEWLSICGSEISSEHFLPKALQIYCESPEIFSNSDFIVEVGDWLVSILTGTHSRSYCAAAYKTYFNNGKDVSPEFLNKVQPGFGALLYKHYENMGCPGDTAGRLTAESAELMGLRPGIPVSYAGVDAHVSALGCGISEPGKLFMAIGTSICELVMGEHETNIHGTSGVVLNGICPDLYAYEAGQSGVGDMFAWFAQNQVPKTYLEEAENEGVSVQKLLTKKASELKPGENGIVALDWWNGVRSMLMDFDLSGVLVGQTLTTKPEEIYRALLESTAFGARMIIDSFENAGVPINSLHATGGIPMKNPLMMQIYADVTQRDVHIVKRENAAAMGSAVLGIASGTGKGFKDIGIIASEFAPEETVIHPVEENMEIYSKLYNVYSTMYDFFGTKGSVLHHLKNIRKEAKLIK